MKNADIVSVLFKNPTATNRTCCVCGAVVAQLMHAGYKNLISHLQCHHHGYKEAASTCIKNACAPTASMFALKDAANTCGWTKLVALKNFPFAHVDDPVIRDAIRFKPMDKRMLLKRMVSLVGVVDIKVAEELAGEKFVLVFDGFTDAAEHAIAIFAATKKGIRYLAFSPFQDEASQTASEHIAFLDLVLDDYGLDVANMIAIVTDNMETNKAIARRIKAEDSEACSQVETEWVQIQALELHELRWSGCYRMLKRFEDLQRFLHLFVDDCDIEREEVEDGEANEVSSSDSNTGLRRIPMVDLIPSAGEQRKIAELLDEMTAFNVITTRFQRQDMTITTVRDMFDVVMEGHEGLDGYLGVNGQIVEFPDFEAGVVKVQSGSEKTLLAAERKAVSHLLCLQHSIAHEPIDAPRVARSKRKRAAQALDNALSKKARQRTTKASKYEETGWIPATSVVAERFFSMVKSSVGYLRKSMSASTLETVMFLKLNWDLVTLGSVSAAIERSNDAEYVVYSDDE
ncbi:hypothetical protein PR001_g13566 [Phytophthora rubi]|uniref:HAT C-terminal dimerisation domain-containing protein n=1 Tax=Phytophthora rubi TaxID=129364 RepID=A0A6A3LMG8_9STRA|nr:hypothetical protein PR001_g13566 [Phytophthora rubi]